jgi:hypothetical protein
VLCLRRSPCRAGREVRAEVTFSDLVAFDVLIVGVMANFLDNPRGVIVLVKNADEIVPGEFRGK